VTQTIGGVTQIFQVHVCITCTSYIALTTRAATFTINMCLSNSTSGAAYEIQVFSFSRRCSQTGIT
jgi:hypothetical protein